MLWFGAAATVVLGLSSAVMIGVAAGQPWLRFTEDVTFTRILPLAVFTFFSLSILASSELCSAGVESDHFVITKPTVRGEPEALLSSTPCAIFVMLIVQGLMQFGPLRLINTKQPNTLLAAPMIAVHATTALYYVIRTNGEPCSIANRWDHSLFVIPLHYCLWISSVSSQVFTLYHLMSYVERHNRRKGAAPSASPVPTASHRRLAIALLSTQGMLVFGALGDGWHGGSQLINVFFLALSFIAFYVLIYTGVVLPLAACRKSLVTDDPELKYVAILRYRRLAVYFTGMWHLFPVIWLLGNQGMINNNQMLMAYMVSDLLAKIMPPSVYLSIVQMSCTR